MEPKLTCRIESTGAPFGTKIYIGSQEISLIVSEITWKLKAGEEQAEIVLRLPARDVKIDALGRVRSVTVKTLSHGDILIPLGPFEVK